MKVLFISHEDSKFGAPKSLMELIYELKHNYSVEPIVLVHSQDDVYDFCDKNGIECYVTGHINFCCGKKGIFSSYVKLLPKKIMNALLDYRAVKRLKGKINFKEISIIHSNVTIISLGGFLSRVYNIPHVIHLRESVNVTDDFLYCKDYYRWVRSNADRYVAISDFNKIGWINKGLDPHRIETIYNGLSINKAIRENKIDDCLKMIFVGAITPEKGQEFVIEAINGLPGEIRAHICLDIYGTGETEYVDKLKKMLSDYRLQECVHFRGYRNNIDEIFENYNVGIIASKNEAFGRVTVEYMLNSMCVLASNAGANSELIDDGKTGFLYNLDNPKSLTDEIMYLYNNPDLVTEIAENAYVEANDRFKVSVVGKNIYDFYSRYLQ